MSELFTDFLDMFYPHINEVYPSEAKHSVSLSATESDLFLFVYSGRGSAEVEEEMYPLTTGSILQIPRYSRALVTPSNGSLRYYCIHYQYHLIEWDDHDYHMIDEEGKSLPFDPVIQASDPLMFLEEIQLMHRIWTQRGLGFKGKAKLAFMNLMLRLMDKQKSPNAGISTEQSILDCVEYIEEHYQEMLERDALAKKFSISSSYFSVLFKKHVGCSPVQYITKVRIEKAKELLKDSSVPVSAIAFEVGFNDPLYFTRVFSRQVGHTPKQYREGALSLVEMRGQ